MFRRRIERIGRARARSLRITTPNVARSATSISSILESSTTWDAGNLVDGAGESKDVTVTGAALGDFAVACLGVDLQGMVISAHVKSSNTVTVRLQNESGGALDLASTTVKVLVFKTSQVGAG